MYIVEVTSNISIVYLPPPYMGCWVEQKNCREQKGIAGYEKCKGIPDGY